MIHPRQKHRTYRGAVLIIVLILMALLAMLVVAYATNTVLERDVARNYIDEVRARLVARAGIEHAISRIQAAVQRGHYDDPSMTYWGSKTTEKGEPDVQTPLASALNPSFALEQEDAQNPEDENTFPAQFKIDDKTIGLSGTMAASTYDMNADVYRLRISDANSRIYVNDGLKDVHVTQNLRRILNNLGDVCEVKNVGERLINRRPAKVGYRSRRELIDVLGERDYKTLSQHLTLWAWVDKDLVNPVPLSAEVLRAYPIDYNEAISIYRYGRSYDAEGTLIDSALRFAPEYANPQDHDHAIVALDEVSAPWISRSSRAPVNINNASEEVLTSLIVGLQGFFVVERRKNNPGELTYSPYVYPKANNRPGGAASMDQLSDEYGYLYSTQPFEAPRKSTGTGSRSGGVEADRIAREMIACRNREKSPHGGVDYSNEWFGGPFRTWRQFNAFVDNLVTIGLLVDRRPIYYEYSGVLEAAGGPFGGSYTGSNTLVASGIGSYLGAEALASVLKANFNPNCTLNELNPDRNLFMVVDKTDLICNSTEFCFTPMGTFDIECEGMVLKTAGHDDFLKSKAGQMQARASFECGVQLFEVFRDSTQADFQKGNLGKRVPGRATNSNRGLEIGPEPDIGKAALECRWSGWVQLSTNGGATRPLESGAVMTTVPGDTELGAKAMAHYQFDHRLNYHAGMNTNLYEVSADLRNLPDRTEKNPGPYSPPKGHYRLGFDWNEEEKVPVAVVRAPSDLRIDGTYIERDSACMYKCDSAVFATQGTVAYWIKPSFRPENTGKPRTFFSTEAKQGSMPLMNGHWFFPSHHTANYGYSYWQGPWNPASFVAGFSTLQPSRGGSGLMTETLAEIKNGVANQVEFKHHEWVHVSYMWDMDSRSASIHINGKEKAYTPIVVHPGISEASDWTSENAVFRFGEPSQTMEYAWSAMHVWGGASVAPGNPLISRNWAADSTMDEIYLWKGNQLAMADSLFDRGRYYVPRPGRETTFASRPLFDNVITGQKLPPPTTALAPVVTGTSDRHRSTGTTTLQDLKSIEGTRILCAFWTWHPERSQAKEGRPEILDHFTGDYLEAQVHLQMLLNEQASGPLLTDDGGSGLEDLVVLPGQKIQYQLRVSLPKARAGAILLTTPVVDDVTIFYSSGRRYLHCGTFETTP